ncbi:MAG TPA: hypothetical protein DEF36_07310 [Desulfotomaculum sp.]|nr:hypothetical protein [Desulfotomaculum sp.]
MVFINLRKAFISVMFVLGAAALLLVYTGSSGLFSSVARTSGQISPAPPVEQTVSGINTGAGLQEETVTAKGEQGNENFFVEYRLQREKSRGRQVELLEDIVNNPSSAAETRKAAQDQLMAISGSISNEVRVENLLRAKGYRDAVVCMDSRGVTVVMEYSATLSPAEEASIIEIVSRETGFGEQGIVIIPKKQ